MKHIILLTSFIFSILISFGQKTITEKQLKEIESSYNQNDAYMKAVTNAVSNNTIGKLALNRQNIGKFDHEFKYKIKTNGITDQESSGRCWMFTSLNVMRPKAMQKFELPMFEYSENYLYFWDIFEKSNLFLENIIETRHQKIDDREVEWLFNNVVGDGGVWNSYTNLAEKYGLVPKEVMPETNSSENTRIMVRLIRRKLRGDALKLRNMKGTDDVLRQAKINMLKDIYKMLCINLGVPPAEFMWRYKDKDGNLTTYKKYTPKLFMKASLGEIKFSDYVMLMDDPTKPYYKLYEIKKDRNVLEGKNWKFINLPAKEIKKYALKSLQNNEAMYFSCDVGKQLNKDEGLLDTDNYDYESLFGVKFDMNKKERILSHESGSTHGMALVGVDVDQKGNITKWLLENSWGKSSGHNGYLTMTDRWFNEYMFRVVILKKFIDERTLKILNQKPVMLPPWDPMFQEDM
ncbi:MAG: C1 family peptidase [Bacteroidales bacterium]|nr:C1 family peptidase [Bacteroidales bacterium]